MACLAAGPGAGSLNEPLQRATLQARLREEDVAVRLGVDLETVRRWSYGRVRTRVVEQDQPTFWEWTRADRARRGRTTRVRVRPQELGEVYPHRWAIPGDVWTRSSSPPSVRLSYLPDSASFLAEDAALLGMIANKADRGVRVRIALGDPASCRRPTWPGRGHRR